jgi:hypothetical protein
MTRAGLFSTLLVSSSEGVYTAPSLAPGEYRIQVELAGFKPIRREGIHLSTGEKTRLDLELSVGSIRQRLSRGLTYSAAYTRSKLTDIASSVFDASVLTGPLTNAAVADSHNLERDRDYSTGDIPHYFAASVVWDLPFGTGRARVPGGVVGALLNDWTLAGFMTKQSGVPVAVTQANSLGYAGFTTQRPNLVGDPTLPAEERTPTRWFNTAAFATANQFTIGSASRNPVRGPGYSDVDLALMRTVGLGGGRSIEMRVEVFNLLNTANFAVPAAQLGPASFGTITTALDPRVVQLAAKFWF